MTDTQGAFVLRLAVRTWFSAPCAEMREGSPVSEVADGARLVLSCCARRCKQNALPGSELVSPYAGNLPPSGPVRARRVQEGGWAVSRPSPPMPLH